MQAILRRLDEILAALDEVEGDAALEEYCAELEDAIFLLSCAEDAEEADGALEELQALAEELQALHQPLRAGELSATVALARRNLPH